MPRELSRTTMNCFVLCQKFCHILGTLGTIRHLLMFYRSREGDEPHRTVRCRVRLILNKIKANPVRRSSDLLLWPGVQPRNARF